MWFNIICRKTEVCVSARSVFSSVLYSFECPWTSCCILVPKWNTCNSRLCFHVIVSLHYSWKTLSSLFKIRVLTSAVSSRSDGGSSTEGSTARSDSPAPSAAFPPQEETEKPPDPELEKRLLGYLSDLSLSMPIDSLAITNELNSVSLCLKRRKALMSY